MVKSANGADKKKGPPSRLKTGYCANVASLAAGALGGGGDVVGGADGPGAVGPFARFALGVGELEELVRELAARGWKQAIGSSAPIENIQLLLDATGLTGYMQAIASGNDVTRGKPDPQVFLVAFPTVEPWAILHPLIDDLF